MNCQTCDKQYNSQNRVPKLLIQCGHSLCSECVDKLYSNKQLICPECSTTNHAESVAHFPKNLALIQMKKKPESSSRHKKKKEKAQVHERRESASGNICEKHNKMIEGNFPFDL